MGEILALRECSGGFCGWNSFNWGDLFVRELLVHCHLLLRENRDEVLKKDSASDRKFERIGRKFEYPRFQIKARSVLVLEQRVKHRREF